MKARTIKAVAEGQWVVEGAGVKLKRIFGFGDTALFSRQFRQVTGISPTGFRKNT